MRIDELTALRRWEIQDKIRDTANIDPTPAQVMEDPGVRTAQNLRLRTCDCAGMIVGNHRSVLREMQDSIGDLILALLLWGGLYLHDMRLRELIPLRKR
jgi:hypothetical protein